MDYPSWAPSVLVELYKKILERPEIVPSTDEHIARLKQDTKFSAKDNAFWDRLRRDYFRTNIMHLVDREGIELLARLLTDLRMKKAWNSIKKRAPTDEHYSRFWYECQNAIQEWIGSQKQTSVERTKYLGDIAKRAQELRLMLDDSDDFHEYQIGNLLGDKRTDELIRTLPLESRHKKYLKTIDDRRGYYLFAVNNVLPSISEVLLDIEKNSIEYQELAVLVKKPNSDNAHIHFFVRRLSRHFQRTYNQPLHEVIAATASVVFNRKDGDEIDSDYVRKLLKTRPGDLSA